MIRLIPGKNLLKDCSEVPEEFVTVKLVGWEELEGTSDDVVACIVADCCC